MKSLAFESLIRQLRANPRLQWGAAIAVLLCAALALQAIDGWRSRMQQRSVDAEVEARKVIALRKQMVWVERAREAEALKKKLDSRIPVVASPGIAQATLQSSLRSAAKTIAGVQRLGVEVGDPAQVENRPGLYRVRATVSAEVAPKKAFDLISILESSPNLTLIEGSSIRSGDGQQSTINVAAFYRTPEATPAEDATPGATP